MKKILILFSALLICYSCNNKNECNINPTAQRIILDTDMGNDIDDAEALDLLYKYMDEGRINLIGILLNKEGALTAKYMDLMARWYGYEGIPMGIARNAGNSGRDPSLRYTGQVCSLQNEDGTPLFESNDVDYDNLPDGHILYRKLLAEQPDSSVIIVSTGFLTNLARLLETPADEYSPLTGKELVAKKVKLLSIMAGRFSENIPECNVVHNIPASKTTFNEWPGKMVLLTWELGTAVKYPAESIENDFNWIKAHPLKESYIRYNKMPYNNSMFDPTAVVYAIEGENPKYFTSSGNGKVTVDDEGITWFEKQENGDQSYMMVNDEQAKALQQYFVSYLTKKPKKYMTNE